MTGKTLAEHLLAIRKEDSASEIEQNKTNNRMSKSVNVRYGVKVDFNAYVPGDLARLVCLLICIFFIPFMSIKQTY